MACEKAGQSCRYAEVVRMKADILQRPRPMQDNVPHESYEQERSCGCASFVGNSSAVGIE